MPSSSDWTDTFVINASAGSYAVVVGEGLLQETLSEPRESVFIVDGLLAAPVINAGLDPIIIAADEHAKSLDRMASIIEAMRDRRVTRDTLLVAIGGGVVQDVAAFAAAIYMRGIDWIYVPTTLLSMTDSCIGGKSSINVGSFKNIVGTFHPPQRVVIDPTLAGTLSMEHRVAGLCEAAKICFCRGADAFHSYLALDPVANTDTATLARVASLSLRSKQWFIEIDEFDKAERLVLNFGHTFGHALEAASEFRVSHGIAVGLGMLAALNLGATMGFDYGAAPHVAALRTHVSTLVGSVEGLPEALARIDIAKCMEAFDGDKKHRQDAYAVILVNPDGAAERRMLPRDTANAAMIANAFATMLDTWISVRVADAA